MLFLYASLFKFNLIKSKTVKNSPDLAITRILVLLKSALE